MSSRWSGQLRGGWVEFGGFVDPVDVEDFAGDGAGDGLVFGDEVFADPDAFGRYDLGGDEGLFGIEQDHGLPVVAGPEEDVGGVGKLLGWGSRGVGVGDRFLLDADFLPP